MRYRPEHKEETRQTILDTAARMFRGQGYQSSGVDAVMKEAGLTRGGFYAHFANKEALFAEVVHVAFARATEILEGPLKDLEGKVWLEGWVARYLSDGHCGMPEAGCPLPPLVAELSRAGAGPRQSFREQIQSWVERLSRHLNHLPETERRSAALAAISTCSGAMSVTRAIDDPVLRAELLKSARDAARRALRLDHDEPSDSEE